MSNEHTQKEGSPFEDAPQQYPLGQLFEAYERRYRHLGTVEFDNSSRRMELYHRLYNLRQHLDRLQGSVELLLEPSTSTASPKKPRARRKKLQSDVKLDLRATFDQVQALDELTKELRENDRKQEDAETSFDNAVQSISTKLRQSKLIPEDEKALEVSLAPTITSISEHQGESSPPLAAELAAYYDAVGMLRIMAERIGELQAEQQEQWERRGVMEDQGQILDQSDDEFSRKWNDTLDTAYKDFTTAQADVEKTRQQCEAMNISIPTWADVDSVGDKADPLCDDAPVQGMVSPPNSGIVISQPLSHKGLPLVIDETLLHDRGSPLATPPYNPLAKNRVARWIEDTEDTISTLDIQPHDFPQGTPLASSEDVTPVMGQQHRSTVPIMARSASTPASTLPYNIALGAVAAAPRASSLGAEQGLEVDDKLRKTAPLENTSSL